MLLTMEEIKAQLRLDEDFDADDRHLQLLACAAQKRTETYLNRKVYAPDETIPESDPDGLHLPDDTRRLRKWRNSTCRRVLAGLSARTGTFRNENSSGADQRNLHSAGPR